LNAPCSIRDNFDPDSKITEESDLHALKHRSHNISTDEGITISTNPVSWNAQCPICDNLDSDLNITEESPWQP
jgi:hypothetical protein